MIKHLEERRRFLELYCPCGNYKEHEVEEIKAIEKKLGFGNDCADCWVRTPEGYILICAVTNLPIMASDDYCVVLRSEFDALKKRARDVVIDELKSLLRKE